MSSATFLESHLVTEMTCDQMAAAGVSAAKLVHMPRRFFPLSRWLPRTTRAILVCLTTLLGAGAIGPLYSQHQVSTFFPAGADARAAIYGPLLDTSTGAAPRTALGQAVPAEGRNPVVLAAAGVVGGGVGLMAGGIAAGLVGEISCRYPFSGNDSCESRVFDAAALGVILGEAMLLPLGVHIADRRRGNYALMTLSSLGIAAGGLGLATTVGRDRAGPILVSTVLTQLVTSIMIERWTAGRKAVPE